MTGLNRTKLLPEGTYFRHLFVYVFGMAITLSMVTISLGAEVEKNNEIEAVFKKKYEEWKNYRKQHVPPFSSVVTVDMEGQPFLEMVKLGIPALPYMMEKIENDAREGGRFLVSAVSEITRKKFHITRTGQRPKEFRWTVEEFPDMKDLTNPPRRYKLWLRWWKEGSIHTSQQFEKFYQGWKELNQEGKEAEAKAKYQRMIELGVAALPYMIEKVEQGDAELVPAISELTDSKVKKDTKQSECLNWWKENKEKWLIPFPEVEPQTTAKKTMSHP